MGTTKEYAEVPLKELDSAKQPGDPQVSKELRQIHIHTPSHINPFSVSFKALQGKKLTLAIVKEEMMSKSCSFKIGKEVNKYFRRVLISF